MFTVEVICRAYFFRWSPENKTKRSPYTYMAFGTGPRNCVGMRFAMEELKMALFTLVQKFRFYPVEETLVLRPSFFLTFIKPLL